MAKRILVIGGGASGLMAAVTAAREGASVTVLEHNEKPGKKLSATGNGRGNFTNASILPDNYRCSGGTFETVLSAFTQSDTLAFFTGIGLLYQQREDRFYPLSGQASALTELLLMEAGRQKVRIKTREHVREIRREGAGFLVLTETWQYAADRVILASGSGASAIAGADGSGYALAEALGHHLEPVLPALVPLKCRGRRFASWSGVRTDGRVTLAVDGSPVCSSSGELQLTEYGISGIPVFQISSEAVRALHRGRKVTVRINFLKDLSPEETEQFLEERRKAFPGAQSRKELLTGVFHEKLIPVLAAEKDLTEAISGYELQVTGHQGPDHAQVCSGGVSLREVHPETLESRIVPGLYFAGEILDVDGDCGGYNLQWAWSSGYTAGKHAAEQI